MLAFFKNAKNIKIFFKSMDFLIVFFLIKYLYENYTIEIKPKKKKNTETTSEQDDVIFPKPKKPKFLQ